MAIDLHIIEAVRHFFPDVFRGVQMIAALVNIAQTHRLPDFNRTGIGRFLTGQQLKQR